MKCDFLQGCINATVFTYQKMLKCTPVVVGERYTQTGIIHLSNVTALIGFNGTVMGAMVISMNESEAIKTSNLFLYGKLPKEQQMEQTLLYEDEHVKLITKHLDVNDEVLDSVEEIVNIVSGAAAAKFPYRCLLGLPTILMGQRQRLHGSEDSKWHFIKMKSEQLGEFTIGATLKEV